MKRTIIRSVAPVIIILLLLSVSVWMVFHDGELQRNWLVSTFRQTTDYFSGKLHNATLYFSLKSENERLSKENSELIEENLKYASVITNHEMSSDTVKHIGHYLMIPASVIQCTTDEPNNFLILDKGSEDGIIEDMGVMTRSGIVGYIVGTSSHYSKVSSFLSIGSKYSAVLAKSGTFGTFSWTGRFHDEAILSEIPVHTQVDVGDTVVSSGFSSLFPPGIPLGIVDSKDLTDGINYSLSISLFLNFKALKYVYVAKYSDMEEIDSLLVNE